MGTCLYCKIIVEDDENVVVVFAGDSEPKLKL